MVNPLGEQIVGEGEGEGESESESVNESKSQRLWATQA